jgi:CubicO group peptidase (beta-lactamase class C family)
MGARRQSAALAFVLALAPALAAAEAPAPCGAPAALPDGWALAAPAQQGLDPQRICAIGPALETLKRAAPEGVVVARHGALVYEHYFGADPTARAAGTVHEIYAITTNLVALLTGIAFARGWLNDIDAPVFSFLPEYAALRTPGKARITLRDLLTMTSGLAWPELFVAHDDPANIARRMRRAPDPYRFVLQQPLAAMPGTMWNYDSGGVELLGLVLEKVARRPLDVFARKALFAPLGITDWAWRRLGGAARPGPAASSGLLLRPRDLAKIGQLVLNRGLWHGRRIVPAAWIKEMTAPQIPPWWLLNGEAGAQSYGYLWWRGRSWVRDRPFEWIGGLGWGGQRLYVVPRLDMVVVVTAGAYYRPSYAQDLAGERALAMALRAALTH